MATPTQVLHDTIRTVVHDTLQVRGAAGDGFGWEKGLTLVGLIVIPLVAAWYGAREGANRAGAAAMNLHQATIKADKEARQEERRANSEEREDSRNDELNGRRAQMVERIKRILNRVVVLGTDVPGDNNFLELGKRGAEMRILWHSFERQSGDLYLVGSAKLRSEIAAFIGGLQIAVAATEAALSEREERRHIAMIASPRSGEAPSNINTKHDPKDILDAFRGSLTKNKEEAERLLKAMDA